VILLFSINLNIRILDVFEKHYAGNIEDRRALALGSGGAVMLWRTPALPDKTIDWARESVNTIALTRKDAVSRCLSQCDAAATIHAFCDPKCARPIDDSGCQPGRQNNRTARFAGQPDSSEC
jgi:hypothetical protein